MGIVSELFPARSSIFHHAAHRIASALEYLQFKRLQRVRLDETHILHRDILELCCCVLGHRLNPGRQPWKKRYIELAARLGFARFDKTFFKTAYRKITTLQP